MNSRNIYSKVYLFVLTGMLLVIGNSIMAQVGITASQDTICGGDSTLLTAGGCTAIEDDFDPAIDFALWDSISGGTAGTGCGSLSGNALYFDSTVNRFAATIGLNVLSGGTYSFYLKIGAGIAPCENADVGEDVRFEYSKNGGQSWITIATYDESMYNTFTLITNAIPPGAWSSSTQFRWRQLANSGLGFDNWSLDSINISCGGSTGPYTYLWGPTALLNDTSIMSPMAYPTVTSTFTVTITDTTGSYTDSIIIIIDTIVVVASANQSICINDSAQIVAVSSLSGTSYSWAPAAGLSCTNCANPKASPASTTTYTVIGTSSACSDTDSVTVNINSYPTVGITNDTALCLGDSVTLIVTGGTTYAWTPTTNLSNAVYDTTFAFPIVNSWYYVDVTSDSGCTSMDSIMLTVNGVDNVVITKSRDTICIGDTISLVATLPTSCADYKIRAISYAPFSGSGTAVALGDDEVSSALPIGFTFNFYCIDYTQFYISSNGFITFDSNSVQGCCMGQLLPNTKDPDNLVSFAWNDLDPSSGGTIEYFTTGTAPNRKLVMSFLGVNHYLGVAPVTSQVVLYESSNWVEIHTTDMPANGGVHTMGIENDDGTRAHVVVGRDSTVWSASNEGQRFIPLIPESTTTFSWTPAATLNDPNILTPIATPVLNSTAYVITVTDSSCSITNTMIVYADTIELAVTINSDSVCLGDSIKLGATSNLSTTTFTWNPSVGLSCFDCPDPMAGPTVTTTYTVIATSAMCSDSDTVRITVLSLPIAFAGGDSTICNGGGDTLFATGGDFYAWTPATGLNNAAIDSPIASPVRTQEYVVTVSDSFGCKDTDTVLVTIRNFPVTISSTLDTICPNDSAVFSANACGYMSDDFNPKEDKNQWLNITGGTAKTTCGVLGGSGKALYFNGGGIREAVTNEFHIDSGGLISFYLLVSTGDDPCEKVDPGDEVVIQYREVDSTNWVTIATYDVTSYPTFTFVQESVPPGTFGKKVYFRWAQPKHSGKDFDNWTLENVEIICYGNASTGTPSYVWTPSTGLSDDSVSIPKASPAVTTTYTVNITDSGCVQSGTFTLTVANMTVDIPASQTICYGDSLNLSLTANVHVDSFTWSPATGLSCTNCSTVLAYPTVTTTYTVIGYSVACNDTDLVTITVNPLPIANAGNDIVFCRGDSLQLSATGGLLYVWTPNIGLTDDLISNPFASRLNSSEYVVKVTDALGCIDYDTVVVNVNNLELDMSPVADTICNGDSIQIAALVCNVLYDDFDPGIDLTQWAEISSGIGSSACGSVTGDALYFNGGGIRAATSNNMNVSAGGTIDFYLKISQGISPCDNTEPGDDVVLEYSTNIGQTWTIISTYDEANYGSFTNIIEAIPALAQTTGTIFRWRQLAHSGAFLDNWALDNITIACNAINSGYTFVWNPSIGLSDTTIANPIAFPTTTTTYTLSLSDSLCALTDSVSITIDSMIISAGPEGPLCFGVSVQLVVTSSVPGASYSWAPTAGLSCTNCQNPVATPSSDVTYTVTATSNNCSAVDSVTFSVTQLYFANAGADTSICINDSVILNATGGTTYSWSPGSSLSDSTISTPSAFPIINTDYVVLVTDPNGCTDMDTVSVTAFAIPTAAVSSDTGICLGDTIALTASGGTSFSWSPGLTLSDSTSSTPFATPTDTTLYTVTVMNINGCTDTASVTIETYPKPLTDAGPDSTICLGDTIQINASGGGSFQWTPITGISNSNISNPLAFPTSTTTYTLVSSNGTCSDNDVMTITVIDVPVANFIIDSIVWKTVYFQNTSVDATSFRWDFGDGKSDSTNFNPVHLYDTAGTFNVTLFVFNKCGSDSISVPAVIVFTDVVNLANATTLKIYPNPYSGYTNISYKISKSSKISLKVFDLLGREIETLVDAEQSSGTYTYQFSAVESIGGQGIAPENAKGIYILRMMVDDELYIRKLIEVDK